MKYSNYNSVQWNIWNEKCDWAFRLKTYHGYNISPQKTRISNIYFYNEYDI